MTEPATNLDHRHPGGRRTTLTPELANGICDIIREGNYLRDACEYHGVSEHTVLKWLARGNAELERDPNLTPYQRAEQGIPPASREAPYAQFAQAVTIARGYSVVTTVRFIHKRIRGGEPIERRLPDGTVEITQTPPDGRLGLEYLSRIRPHQFGRRQLVEVTGHEGGAVQVQVTEGVRIAERLRDFTARLQANPAIIDADADERLARRVIDVPPDRPAVTDGSEHDGTDRTDDDDGD